VGGSLLRKETSLQQTLFGVDVYMRSVGHGVTGSVAVLTSGSFLIVKAALLNYLELSVQK
jgi:hypothetical protein